MTDLAEIIEDLKKRLHSPDAPELANLADEASRFLSAASERLLRIAAFATDAITNEQRKSGR